MADLDIAAVVFDIGGVLLDWDPRHLYRKLIDDPADLAEFLGQICTPQWHLAHDLGEDTEQSCRELAVRHPAYADLIMAWAGRGEEMIAGQLDATVDVLAEVRALGVRCFALSNMEADKYALRRSRYPFFGLLDGCVISGVEHVAKPDQAIFEILLSRYELEPQATVFVDDMPRNVAVAREIGMVGLQFSTADRLREDLRDLGVLVDAEDTARKPEGGGQNAEVASS
jgi:2-haloacid dehalogenase